MASVVAQEVFESYGYELRLTHSLDGVHSFSSLHYHPSADDYGLAHVPKRFHKEIHEQLIKDLNAGPYQEFDVILHEGGTHIHVEWQPKRPVNFIKFA